MAFSQILVISSLILGKKPSHINAKEIRNWLSIQGIQTNQILTNDDEVCIPRLSSILLAVTAQQLHTT